MRRIILTLVAAATLATPAAANPSGGEHSDLLLAPIMTVLNALTPGPKIKIYICPSRRSPS